jgi:hypothetical protein
MVSAKTAQIRRAFDAAPAGSLHRALHVAHGAKIPIGKLREAARWTGRRKVLGKRAAMLLNFHRGRLRTKRDAA